MAGVAQWAAASFCAPKGCGFDSWSGHRPGLWVQSPVGTLTEGNQSMFPSLLSLPPFLSLKSKKRCPRRGQGDTGMANWHVETYLHRRLQWSVSRSRTPGPTAGTATHGPERWQGCRRNTSFLFALSHLLICPPRGHACLFWREGRDGNTNVTERHSSLPLVCTPTGTGPATKGRAPTGN